MHRLLFFFVLLAVACGGDPESAESQSPVLVVPAERMVSAPNPLAVLVGNQVLDQGGNAMDAAVAVQMVLGFVEAPETGIGGGGFLLYHAAGNERPEIYDGRETAPAAATPHRFTLLGQPLPLWMTIPSGQAVGVPGLVAMLGQAHEEHGTLHWADLLAPAISLAEEGVAMPERLQRQIRHDPSLRLFADTREYFVQQAREPEPRLHNPELAQSLRLLAGAGPPALYDGPLGEALVERARTRRPGASDLTMDDLRAYQAVVREPLCAPYRDWRLCTVGPPSSGGVAVLQTLSMLETHDLAALDPQQPADLERAVHLIAEASRLAMADRARWLGDADYSAVPLDNLLDRDYLASRARLIDLHNASPETPPGRFADNQDWRTAGMDDRIGSGTSHVTIVDEEGNLAVLTSSIEMPFGARMMAGGFLLNNQLTDFRFVPDYQGERHPNAVQPGKRPRSSMTPLVVYNADDEPVLALGSRGGGRISGYVTQVLIAVLDWEQPLQDAIAAPRFLHTGQALELETGTPLTELASGLTGRGHRVEVRSLTSGVHGVQRLGEVWSGGADPRLGGMASGHLSTDVSAAEGH
ncbi:MAG: gamma-glutamyltransferase [Natronospirillum sp.]|uniref:gamma-glutamyltransferase n=1 Tax=Natronospirillum sp. TaxID=2812955 RepID=UPI0025F83646|nr:gamma-glutamyltransferase [Natronospirillum sp.]MCH8552101.1 gamma-glutamyltransferase [Natronospirillum sp.]